MDPFLGEMRFFGFNFAPQGWAMCNGQTLSISQNSALYALLGVQYGGNGTTTFQLPDLRGRAPVGMGAGPGLSSYSMGQAGGNEAVTLTAANLPPHVHGVPVSSSAATTSRPGVPARGGSYAATSDGTGGSTSPGPGQSSPVPVQSPFLVGNWCIALQGIFPPRS